MARKQKRRNNGEGTVRIRADGRCEVRIPSKVVAALGCSRSFYGSTAAEALAKRDAAMRLADAGITMDAQSTTLGDYIERWLSQKASEGSRPNTINAYRHALSLTNSIHHLTLAEVRPAEVKQLYARLEDDGVSASMRHKAHGKLKSVMKEVVIDGLLPANPLDRVRGPKAPKVKISFWTEAQLLGFLRAIPEGEFAYALFYVFAFTGMRRGEVLGLHWDDLLLRGDGSGALRVERSWTAGQREDDDSPPKTDSSHREVAITPDVVAVLERQRTRVDAMRRSRGALWHGTPAIFPSEVGTYHDPRNTNRLFDYWQERAGVHRIRVHDLRHTHASILIANGYDAGVVSDRLGHKNVAFTMSYYRHLFDRQRRAAAFGLADLVRAEGQQPTGPAPSRAPVN